MSCALTPAEVARSGIQTAFFTRLGPLESVPGGKSTIGAWNSSRGRYSGARTARWCCRANVIWEMSVQVSLQRSSYSGLVRHLWKDLHLCLELV